MTTHAESRVGGCSHGHSKLVTIVIWQILYSWHDYLWPFLVITRDSCKTLVADLVGFEVRLTTDYGPLVAGYALTSVPLLILFIVAMRSFIAGLSQEL